MVRKLLSFVFVFCASLGAEFPRSSVQSLASIFYAQFDAYKLHSRSLYARSGELRSNVLQNGLWLNEEFGFLEHRELDYALQSKDFYNNLSLGVDTSFALRRAKLYLGGALDVIAGYSQAGSYSGSRGNYALGVYLSYVHEMQFFFDVNAKYFYAAQNFIFQDPSLSDSVYGKDGSHFYFGVNFGQRFNTSFSPFVKNFFFLEPSIVLETGYLPAQKFILKDGVGGKMKRFYPLGVKFNLAFGREWNASYKGSVKAGLSIEYDRQINGEMSFEDGINPPLLLSKEDDFGVGLFAEADFLLNEKLRFFFRAKTSLAQKISIPYAMNLGIRFSFGQVLQHGLHSKKSIDWQSENLQ